jgi:hypothetical protein
MKRLLLIPPIAIAVFVAGHLLLPASALPVFRQLLVVAGLLAAAVTNGQTGLAFAAGERLRTAWLANGVSCFISGVIIAMATIDGTSSSLAIVILRVVFTVLANVAGVLSLWTFGRAYRETGLADMLMSRRRRAALIIGALAIGCAVAGLPAYRSLAAAIQGDLDVLVAALSTIGDIVIFVFLMPVFFAVLGLRGGLLVWPWTFFFAADLAWLVSDIQGAFTPTWGDIWLVIASTLTVSAALAQRRILSRDATP